jgi:hypothetical protein
MYNRYIQTYNTVNWSHPSNCNLRFWLLNLPSNKKRDIWVDITNRNNGAFSTTAPYVPKRDFVGLRRPGGYGSITTYSGSVDSGIDIANFTNLGNVDFGFYAWVYSPNTDATIANKPNPPSANEFRIEYEDSVGTLLLNLNGNAVSVSLGALALNNWGHIAITRSGTTIKFYFNGKIVGTNTIASFVTTTSTLRLGDGSATNVGTNHYDDIALVTHRCPSDGEIYQRYVNSLRGYPLELNRLIVRNYIFIPGQPPPPSDRPRRDIFQPWLESVQSK